MSSRLKSVHGYANAPAETPTEPAPEKIKSSKKTKYVTVTSIPTTPNVWGVKKEAKGIHSHHLWML